jgi:myo-inositol-1-phosphate synthase
VPWLEDRKFCYIRMEGTTFGNVPISCELKLEVWDSPNSAGVVIDAVRCAKLAMDRGVGGALVGPASYFMKSPPEQFTDAEAHERTEAFIREHALHAGAPAGQNGSARPGSNGSSRIAGLSGAAKAGGPAKGAPNGAPRPSAHGRRAP